MVRTGFIKAKKGNCLSVCFERPSSCEGCKGCAKGLMSKTELLTVFGDAEVGDIVDVQMPENQIFKASLLAYAVPLVLLIAGLLIGDALNAGDVLSLLLAVVGLLLGYVVARAVEKQLRKQPKWCPTIIAARKPQK